MNFAYEKPRTAEALAKLLAEIGPQASLLAGGTDLIVQLRGQVIDPKTIIDVKGVEELHQLTYQADGSVTIGAAVTMNRIVDDARMRFALAALPQAISEIATFAIRNRATVVGNIANASPCADSVPALVVLGASVELRSSAGSRKMLLTDFIKHVRATARRSDEYINAVHIPATSKLTKTFFRKRQRVRGHDLALANAALLYDPDGKHLRVAIGSCSPVPVLLQLDDLYASLDGEEAAKRAMAAISPISDVRSSAEYRTDMTGVMVRRLFADLKG